MSAFSSETDSNIMLIGLYNAYFMLRRIILYVI